MQTGDQNMKTNLQRQPWLTFLAALLAALIAGHGAQAASLTWDANAGGANQTDGAGAWLGAGQWWNGLANTDWTSGDDAIFGKGGAGGAVTLASPTTVNSITFSNFTGTYTLGTAGQMITLNNGINKFGGTAATLVSPITLGGDQAWTNNSGGLLTTANGANLMDNAGYQLTIEGTGNITLGVINNDAPSLTGSGNLIKNGTGVLALGGVNAGFTGNITVNGGVLRVTKPASITGNLNLAGGVYEHYWSDAYTNGLGVGAGQIQITGGVSGFSENGATAVTFTLNNSAAFELVWGSPLFNPSIFVLQADTAQGSSSLTLANKIDLNGADRTIHVAGGTTGAARATVSGQIRNSTGTAGLTKTGAGMLNLGNTASAWNGNTDIQGGILDFGGIANANIGGGSGRNITVAAGAGVRFNALNNTLLNRLVETDAEITVMTGTTANNLDFSSSAGANLPNAFLGNWAGNGAKCEYSGILTPASDAYRLGAKGSSGLLGIVGANKLTGARGLIVGGTGGSGIRVELAAAQDFTGDTVIRTGARLFLGNNLALQNSALNLGTGSDTLTGTFSCSAGTGTGPITGDAASPSPTFGGLKGSRNLLTAYNATSAGNNASVLAATNVTGFTLNVGAGSTCAYAGVITNFAPGTTLTKTGEGTQILSGANTYTGATTVSNGTLLVNGSLAAASAVAVYGGTLGGNGTIGGSVTVAEAGSIAPGASAGTLSIGGNCDVSAQAAGTGKLLFELDALAGTSDKISVTGSLAIGSGALGFSDFVFNNLGGLEAGTYKLITSGGVSGTLDGADLSGSIGAFTGTLQITGNDLELVVSSGGCVSPTAYNVTGGGAYCAGGAGVAVALDGSETGVDYQLYRNSGATAVGSPVAGTGNAIGFGNQTVADTYTVVATRVVGGCTNIMTGSATVTISIPATANAGADQVVCASNPNVTLAGSIGGGASSGTWSGGAGTFSPDNATLNAVYTPTADEITAGSVTLTLTTDDPDGPCGAASDAMVITILPTPVITNTPTNLAVCAGSPAIFSVGASGGVLTYQWQGSGDGGNTFTNLSDTATNASYTNLVAMPADSGYQYQVIVISACGLAVTSSPPAVLTVNTPATADAGSDQSVSHTNITVTLAGSFGGSATTAYWSGGEGTFSPDTNTLTASYTPSTAERVAGTVTLTLTTDDPGGACGAATDTVTILLTNSPPVAANFSVAVGSGETNLFNVIGGKHAPTDADNDALTITAVNLVTPANGGQVSIVGGMSLVYVASASFSGTDSFTYTVSDGYGGTDTKTVTVTVTPAGSGANMLANSFQVNGNTVTLRAFGLPGRTYRLQYTDSLSPANWQTVLGSDQTAATNGVMSFSHTDNGALPPARYYRTREVNGI